MPALNGAALAGIAQCELDGVGVEVPRYLRRLDKRICHIGVGGFHRAHQAWYLHRLLQDGLADGWGIIGIGLRPQDRALGEVLQRQDGLYSLWELDGQTRHAGVIGSLFEYVDASADAAQAIALIGDPATRIVSLTVTEAGYCLAGGGGLDLSHPEIAHDLVTPLQPRSAAGLIVRGLELRRRAGIGGLTAMSCDNLLENGHRLRNAVLGFAQQLDAAMARWIEAEVSFPCSMVDRITPVANPAQQEALCADWGVRDNALVVCEPWAQWVLEDHFVAGRPDFDRVGVVWSDHVPCFEAMKVGLLNGAHSVLSHAALMKGYACVHDAAADPALQRWLAIYMNEIAQTLDAPPGIELAGYQRSLIQRFCNPAIGDRLSRLAQDTREKFRQTLTPALQRRLERGDTTDAIATAVALWLQYLQGLATDASACAAYQDSDKERLMALAIASRDAGDAAAFLAHALPLPESQSACFAVGVNLQLRSLRRLGFDAHIAQLPGS